MHIGLGRSLLATWSGHRIIIILVRLLVIYTMMMVSVVVVVVAVVMVVVMVVNTWSWLRYLITWLPYLESV